MTRRDIATISRTIELLEDCIADYDERSQYFADNGKESASRWNARMSDRCQKAMARLEAILDEDE